MLSKAARPSSIGLDDVREVVVEQHRGRRPRAPRRCRSCPWPRRCPPGAARARRSRRRRSSPPPRRGPAARVRSRSFCSGATRASTATPDRRAAPPSSAPSSGELRAEHDASVVEPGGAGDGRGRGGMVAGDHEHADAGARHDATASGTSGRIGSTRPTRPSSLSSLGPGRVVGYRVAGHDAPRGGQHAQSARGELLDRLVHAKLPSGVERLRPVLSRDRATRCQHGLGRRPSRAPRPHRLRGGARCTCVDAPTRTETRATVAPIAPAPPDRDRPCGRE